VKRVLGVIAIILLIGLVWWLVQKPEPLKRVESPKVEEPKRAEVAGTSLPSQPTKEHPDPIKEALEKNPQPVKKEVTHEEKLQTINKWEDQREIDLTFYGKVLDQNSQPVIGAAIKALVVSYRPALPGTPLHPQEYLEVVTDNGGGFSIHAGRTRMFHIDSITKEGYELAAAPNGSYSYDVDRSNPQRFSPDPNKPVVFRMWKKGSVESLVAGDKFYGVVPDGRVYGIDMLKGQKVEGGTAGDFTVRINRPAQITPQTRYDWSFVIEGANGGIIESNDEFMYQAPESGYQPRYEYTMSPTNPNWRETVKKNFYVKSRNGQVYGRMEVEVIASYKDKAVFNVKYYANPAGSRNLEYDSTQVLK
jgi:hypothetical protein